VTALSPLIATIPPNTPFFRIVPSVRGVDGALFFGPASRRPAGGRFDSSTGAFRVCYLAETARGAFAESLVRRATPPDADHGIRSLAAQDIARSAWASTSTTRVLRLADVRNGQGLAPLGLTGALTMSDSHDAGRALSESLHALQPALDGIWFRTRHDPAECGVALYDRAAGAMSPVAELMPLMDDLVKLSEYLDWYRIALDD
jgi:RES domain